METEEVGTLMDLLETGIPVWVAVVALGVILCYRLAKSWLERKKDENAT